MSIWYNWRASRDAGLINYTCLPENHSISNYLEQTYLQIVWKAKVLRDWSQCNASSQSENWNTGDLSTVFLPANYVYQSATCLNNCQITISLSQVTGLGIYQNKSLKSHETKQCLFNDYSNILSTQMIDDVMLSWIFHMFSQKKGTDY